MSSKPSFSNTENNGKEKRHFNKNVIKKKCRYALCCCRNNIFHHERRIMHQVFYITTEKARSLWRSNSYMRRYFMTFENEFTSRKHSIMEKVGSLCKEF